MVKVQKRQLEKFKSENDKLDRLKEQLQDYGLRSTRTDTIRVKTSKGKSQIDKILENREEIERAIENQESKVWAECKNLMQLIGKVKHPTISMILTKYYLSNKSFNKIGLELGLSGLTVKNYFQKAFDKDGFIKDEYLARE